MQLRPCVQALEKSVRLPSGSLPTCLPAVSPLPGPSLQVPEGYAPYPQLAAWVAAQRQLMRVEGALEPGAVAQLQAIGITPALVPQPPQQEAQQQQQP